MRDRNNSVVKYTESNKPRFAIIETVIEKNQGYLLQKQLRYRKSQNRAFLN